MNEYKIISRNTTAQQFRSLQEINESDEIFVEDIGKTKNKESDPFDYLNEENDEQSEDQSSSSESILILDVDETLPQIISGEQLDFDNYDNNTFVKEFFQD